MGVGLAVTGFAMYMIGCDPKGNYCQRTQDQEAYETIEQCVASGKQKTENIENQMKFMFPGQPQGKQGWECYKISGGLDKPVSTGGFKVSEKHG